jgi:hypothetical protein
VVSKLISKMMGGNIAELMNTLQSAGLSEQAQERVLSLISSMSMDSSSMDEIMKSLYEDLVLLAKPSRVRIPLRDGWILFGECRKAF